MSEACTRGHRVNRLLPFCFECEAIDRRQALIRSRTEKRLAEEARQLALKPKRCPKGHPMIAELHIRDCPECFEERRSR